MPAFSSQTADAERKRQPSQQGPELHSQQEPLTHPSGRRALRQFLASYKATGVVGAVLSDCPFGRLESPRAFRAYARTNCKNDRFVASPAARLLEHEYSTPAFALHTSPIVL
jgi:hypothetical protein